MFGEEHSRSSSLTASYEDLCGFGVCVEGNAGFVKHIADPGHIGGGKAHIERFEIGTAQIIAAEPNDREYSGADGCKRSQTPGPKPSQARPKPL